MKNILSIVTVAVFMSVAGTQAANCCAVAGAASDQKAACPATNPTACTKDAVQCPMKATAQCPMQNASLQKTCPVMSGKVSKKHYADYNGKRVYFCCGACVAAFKADPEKYVKKLTDAVVKLEDVPVAK